MVGIQWEVAPVMSNPLTDVLPDKWRRIGYAVLFVVGSLLTATAIGYTAVGTIPTWLVFSLAFYGSITGPLFAVPASNVK